MPISRFLLCCLVLVVSACNGSTGADSAEPLADTTGLASSRAAYDSVVSGIERSLPSFTEPLRALDESERASVAALVLLTRAAGYAEATVPWEEAGLTESIWAEFQRIHPNLRQVAISRMACHGEHLAYASAMASCHQDPDKSEDDCDAEAAPEAAAAIGCLHEELLRLADSIRRIPGRQWPPGPFPWPIDSLPTDPAAGGVPNGRE